MSSPIPEVESRLAKAAGKHAEAEALITAEYTSLRAEILKLIELQSQLVSLTVIGFGAVLSFGFQQRSPAVLLVYPLLAAILQVYWLNHAHAVQRIARYISDVIEPRVGTDVLGWENYVRANPIPRGWIGNWGVRTIFLGSALLALAAAPIVGHLTTGAVVFYIVAIIVTSAMIAVSVFWRE